MGSSNWFLWQKSSVSITTNWAKTEIWDGFLWKVSGDLCQKTLYNVEAHTRPVESSKVSRLQAFPLLQYLQSVLGNDILAIQVPVISWYYSAGSLLLSSCVWIIDSAETFFLVLLVPKMTYLTVFELIRLSSMFVANLNCFETHVCTLRQTLTRGVLSSLSRCHTASSLACKRWEPRGQVSHPWLSPKTSMRIVNFWFSMILRCWLAGDIDPWFVGDMTWMSNMLFSIAFCNILIDCLSCRNSFAWRTVETNFYKGSSHTPNYTNANTYAYILYSAVWHTKTDQNV